MEVSGWKNGKFGAEKSPYLGISVGRSNANRFFSKKWDHVLVEVNGVVAHIKLTSRFWTTCPELRHPVIGGWIRAKGLAPWNAGHPPKLVLVAVTGNKFRLSL